MDPDSRRSLLRGTSKRNTFSFRRSVFFFLTVGLLAGALVFLSSNGTVEQTVESDVGNDSSISSMVDSIFKKLKKESKNAELQKENPVSKWFKDRMEDFNAKPGKGEEAPVGAFSPQDIFKQGQMLLKKERENKKEEQPVADTDKELKDGSGGDFLVSDPDWIYKSFKRKGSQERAVSDMRSVQLASPDSRPGSGTLQKDDSVEGKLKRIALDIEKSENALKEIPDDEVAAGEETPNGDTVYIVHSGVQIQPATTMVPMLVSALTTLPCNYTPPVPTDPCTGNATNVPAPVKPVFYCNLCDCNPCDDQGQVGPWTTASAIGITQNNSTANATTTQHPSGCICPKRASAKDLRYFYVTEAPEDQPPIHHFVVQGDHDLNHIRGAITHVLSKDSLDGDGDEDTDSLSHVVHIAGRHADVTAHLQDINPHEKHVVYKISKAGENPPPSLGNPHAMVIQSMPDPGEGQEDEDEDDEDEDLPSLHIHAIHHIVHHNGKSYLADLSEGFKSPDGESQRVLKVTHHMVHHKGNQYIAHAIDSGDGDEGDMMHIHHILPHEGSAGFIATQQTHFNPNAEKQSFKVTHHLRKSCDGGVTLTMEIQKDSECDTPGIYIAHHMPSPPVIHHFTTSAQPTVVHHVVAMKAKKPTPPPVDIIHQFVPDDDDDQMTHLQYAVPDAGKDSDLHAHMHHVLSNVQNKRSPPPHQVVHMETNVDPEPQMRVHHVVHSIPSDDMSLDDDLPGHILSFGAPAPHTHFLRVQAPLQEYPQDSVSEGNMIKDPPTEHLSVESSVGFSDSEDH